MEGAVQFVPYLRFFPPFGLRVVAYVAAIFGRGHFQATVALAPLIVVVSAGGLIAITRLMIAIARLEVIA